MLRRTIQYILIVLVATILCCPTYSEGQTLAIGQPVPSIMLPSVTGDTFNTATLKGKPYIISFFTTWSETCQNALHFFNNAKLQNKGIEVVSISLDNKSSIVANYFKKNAINFTALFDKKKDSLDTFQVLIIQHLSLLIKKAISRKSTLILMTTSRVLLLLI